MTIDVMLDDIFYDKTFEKIALYVYVGSSEISLNVTSRELKTYAAKLLKLAEYIDKMNNGKVELQ